MTLLAAVFLPMLCSTRPASPYSTSSANHYLSLKMSASANVFCQPSPSADDVLAISFDSYDPAPIPYGQPFTTIYGRGFLSLPAGRLYYGPSATDGAAIIVSDAEMQASLGATGHNGTYPLDYVDESYSVIIPNAITVTFA